MTSYDAPNGKTDEQLLSAYRSGDKASFSNLVTRYQRELFHFLVRFLGDRAAAEDVFQEAFLHVPKDAFRPTYMAPDARPAEVEEMPDVKKRS